MSDIPATSFNVGDSVVGPPATSLDGFVQWIPEPSGFDALHRVNGPVGRFLKDKSAEVQDLARAMAPVDTGMLRDSIYIQYGKWEGGIWSEVGTDVYYAPFQEFGTVHHDAHPFLRPAAMAVFQDTIDNYDWDEDTAGWSGEMFGVEDRFEWDAGSREWSGL